MSFPSLKLIASSWAENKFKLGGNGCLHRTWLPSSLFMCLVECLSLSTLSCLPFSLLCTLFIAYYFWTKQHTFIFTLWLLYVLMSLPYLKKPPQKCDTSLVMRRGICLSGGEWGWKLAWRHGNQRQVNLSSRPASLHKEAVSEGMGRRWKGAASRQNCCLSSETSLASASWIWVHRIHLEDFWAFSIQLLGLRMSLTSSQMMLIIVWNFNF